MYHYQRTEESPRRTLIKRRQKERARGLGLGEKILVKRERERVGARVKELLNPEIKGII